MFYSVSMESALGEDTLEDGNFRGEHRWQRLVVRALLDGGCRVGSHNGTWAKPDVPTWAGHIDDLSDYLLIAHSAPTAVGYKPGARAYVFNFFNGPDPTAAEEIREVVHAVGSNRVALTYNFRHLKPFSKLDRGLQSCVTWLPTPAVPAVDWLADPFTNTVLLWSVRYICELLTAEASFCDRLIGWIRDVMQADTALTFELLSGYDLPDGEAAATIWAVPSFAAAFSGMRERIKIHGSVSWSVVQTIFRRTKLVVSPPSRYGGPPLEAAAVGIPTVGLNRESSFHNESGHPSFPEYMGVEGGTFGLDSALFPLLGRLLHDEAFYRRAGNAYRAYTAEHYTFEAFRRELVRLEMQRGWT